MRFWGTLGLGLLASLLGGCISEQPLRSTSWLQRMRANPGPSGPDVVQMEVDLIERPINDPYLNHGLWKLADEQRMDLDRKAALEENGFQVGQISGLLPPALLALLRSERSCANPRLIIFHAGDPKTLVLGPTLPSCPFQLVSNSQVEPVQLEQALCTLVVTATLAEDGRVHLRFTPQIKHGRSQVVFRSAPTGKDYMMDLDRATETYSDLSWEITAAPHEYVVVGGRMDKPESLGHQCFIRQGETRGVQRLLAIRAGRPLSGGATPEPLDESLATGSAFDKSPSLALQATMTPVQGASP
jgi:hypothetical protein